MKQSQIPYYNPKNSVNLLSFVERFGKSMSRSEETSNTRASTNKAVLQMVNLRLEEGENI